MRGHVVADAADAAATGYLLTSRRTMSEAALSTTLLSTAKNTTPTNHNFYIDTFNSRSVSSSSSCSSSPSSTSFPSTGGESPESTTRDPDLRRSSSVPPPLLLPSSPCSVSTTSSSTSSVLFHEGLSRLDSFVDLTRLHHHHHHHHHNDSEHVPFPYSTTFESCSSYLDGSDLFSCEWSSIQEDDHEDEYLGYLQAAEINRGLTVSTIPTATADDSHQSTFYSEPSPTILYHSRYHGSPSYSTCFFDPSPSSAGTSPSTPHSRQSFGLMAARQLVTPEPAETATYWNTQQQQQQRYQPTMKNTQWRPQSAPKTTNARSASPLMFWNKRGGTSSGHQQLSDDRDESDELWPRVGSSRGYENKSRDDGDSMLVDTVSNHLGRLTPPSPSHSLGTTSSMDSKTKDRDLRISTKEIARVNCEKNLSQGQAPPMITKAEYNALPLAIQRKVR